MRQISPLKTVAKPPPPLAVVAGKIAPLKPLVIDASFVISSGPFASNIVSFVSFPLLELEWR